MFGAPIPTEPPEFWMPDYTSQIEDVIFQAEGDPNHWLRDAIKEHFGINPPCIMDAMDENEELFQFVEDEIIKSMSDPDL